MKDTRAAIVECAFWLFIERGYEGASMACSATIWMRHQRQSG